MNLKVVALIAGAVFCFAAGYYEAEKTAKLEFSKFKLEAEKDYSALLRKKIDADKANAARIAKLDKAHQSAIQKQKQSYEKTIANLRTNYKPSGVPSGTASGGSMPRSGDDSREFVCYSEAEFYERIARSLAIANRCDKLAIDYATLLRMIHHEQ